MLELGFELRHPESHQPIILSGRPQASQWPVPIYIQYCFHGKAVFWVTNTPCLGDSQCEKGLPSKNAGTTLGLSPRQPDLTALCSPKRPLLAPAFIMEDLEDIALDHMDKVRAASRLFVLTSGPGATPAYSLELGVLQAGPCCWERF